jgi:tripartite-type tricarboxylate transporter receptor subunit TctC
MASMGLASTRIASQGQLRILAQTGPVRHPMLPDVPTTAEVGYPDVRMDTWFGIVAPPTLPEPIRKRLADDIGAVSREKPYVDKLSAIGCAVAYKPSSEFVDYIAGESRKWSEIIPALGIRLDD